MHKKELTREEVIERNYHWTEFVNQLVRERGFTPGPAEMPEIQKKFQQYLKDKSKAGSVKT